MKTLKILILSLLVLNANFAFAQANGTNDPNNKDFQFVPCTPTYDPSNPSVLKNDCNYNSLITGVNNAIKYFLIIIIPIVIAMITYSGFLYFGATDNPGNKEKAIHMLRNVGIGIFWVFFGYLIVYSLLKWLIPGQDTNFIPQGQTVEDVIQLKN